MLYEYFSPWGEIEDIAFDAARFSATIRYSHRFYAEFAREAMFDQVLAEDVTDPLKIQWCLEDPQDVEEQVPAKKLKLSDRANLNPKDLVPQISSKKREIKDHTKKSSTLDKMYA